MGNCASDATAGNNQRLPIGHVEDGLPKSSKACDSVLRPLLQSGAIALLDANYLLGFRGDRLPRRQNLPEEAFLSYEEFLGGNGYHESSVCYRRIIVLSHMWQDRDHPDPNRHTLDRLQWALRLNCKELYEKDHFGVFWDFGSLYQHPDHSNGVLRSDREEKLFQEGLQGIPFLFLHPDKFVFQITHHPPNFTPENPHNAKPYDKRGWTVAEYCWSSLQKETFFLCVFDISQLEDNGNSFFDLLACGMYNRQTPFSPGRFDHLVQDLSFTNGKDDRPLIQQLHQKAVTLAYSSLDTLSFDSLGWQNSDAVELLDLLAENYLPSLEFLSLEGNRLSDEFCERFAAAGLQNLVRLNLASNPIGVGITSLASAVLKISFVKLADTDLTVDACTAWMEQLSDEMIQDTKLVQLDLGKNPFGDEGVAILEPILSRVACILLADVGLTDNGCKSLARPQADSKWVKVLLSENYLKSCDVMQKLVYRSPQLRTLYVDDNSLSLLARFKLRKVCKKRQVKLLDAKLGSFKEKSRRDYDALWADADLESFP